MIGFKIASSQDSLDNALSNGTVADEDIAFVSESGEEKIRTQGTDFNFVPSGGYGGQVLTYDEDSGKGVWKDSYDEDQLSYGVSWTTSQSDPTLTRIGNLSMHRSLPIQSKMKGCVVQFNDGVAEVQYWLDSDNWAYKDGGNPDKDETEQDSRLDGYDGEVCVYVPKFYIKSYDGGLDDDNRWVRISETQIDDTWTESPAMYISAYKATVLNTVPDDFGYLSTLSANTAISVQNTETYCRGGNNSSSYDSYLEDNVYRTMLGKPRTSLSRSTMRTYCRKSSGKELMTYVAYKNVMYWLWVIEYATFNSQKTFNAELDSSGFHQGGMGNGPTTVNSSFWSSFTSYYPLFPCGITNELGNGTGTVSVTIPTHSDSYSDQTTTCIRWRGFENTFGDIYTNLEGVNFGPIGVQYNDYLHLLMFITDDPDKFADTMPIDTPDVTEVYAFLETDEDTVDVDIANLMYEFSTDYSDYNEVTSDDDYTYYHRYILTNVVCLSGSQYLNQAIVWDITIAVGDDASEQPSCIYSAIDTGQTLYYYSTKDDCYYVTVDTDDTNQFLKIGDVTNFCEYLCPDGYTWALIGAEGSQNIRYFWLGSSANCIPMYNSSGSSSSSTYKCDYHYANSSVTSARSLYFGGAAHYGSPAGLAFCYSVNAVSNANSYRGFRYMFLA